MPVRFLLLLTIIFFIEITLKAGVFSYAIQNQSNNYVSPDSIPKDSILITEVPADSLNDSLISDSTRQDSLAKPHVKHKESLKDKVKYSSEDSMMISVTGERLYLYGKANVKYQDIDLSADYIMLDMAKEEVFAKGTVDTSGKVIGSPVFKQGSETFDSDSMKYNFKSEKGIIYHIFTKEGEGYLHSEETKRLNDGHINVLHGKYTTCDAKHPHFYIAMTKAIVIPEDKIISGVAYMVVADIPIVFPFIPFGFFPNSTTRSSGIIVPAYGNGGPTRGFYLSNGGWYQVLGEHADVTVQGDIYSKGSWRLSLSPRYVYRYRFNGNFSLSYAINKNNDDINYVQTKEYKVTWRHNQDAKSSPGQTFTADVNFSSTQYDSKNSYDPRDYLSGTQSSSINFTKQWAGLPLNLSLSANAVKNIQTQVVDVELPTGSLTVSSLYPFRRKNVTSKYKWWENVSISYNSTFDNKIHTYDSVLFTQQTIDQMKTGFKQTVPVSVNFKLGKMITITPSVTYTGMIYTRNITKDSLTYYVNRQNPKDTVKIWSDTVHTTNYIQAVNPSIAISFTPKLYGMYLSKKENSYIMAVRHVMSPSASFSFTPNMNNINPNYYDSVFYTNSKKQEKFYEVYSKYQNELYGTPSVYGKSGSLNLALNNSLEMKVRPKNDTTGQPKKVSILDNLNFSTSYRPFVKVNRWSDLVGTAATKLFKNAMNVQLRGQFSPYAIDSTGKVTNRYYYNTNNKILRFTNMSVSSGFTLKSKQGKKKEDSQKNDQVSSANDQQNNFDNNMEYPLSSNNGKYVDFNVPWSASFTYSWTYSKTGLTANIQHIINFNGDFSLTPKWKIGCQGGYDIKAKQATSLSLNIFRDLHCWQMTFNVTPFGKYRNYSFSIQAKSSLLRDIKYDKKSDSRYDY